MLYFYTYPNENKYMKKINKLALEIAHLTDTECEELKSVLYEYHGINLVSMAGAEAENDKHSFDIILKNAGERRLTVLKYVNEITGKGLMLSKELVDKAPCCIINKPKISTEVIKRELENMGATVELK